MTGRGLIITGTRGAGKTTMSELLVSSNIGFACVPAVTTRQPRADDRPGAYRYITLARFQELTSAGLLLVRGQYGGNAYGIETSAVGNIWQAGLRPIMTITPASAVDLLSVPGRGHWSGMFMDAPDKVLDARLIQAGRPANAGDSVQRLADRMHAASPLVVLQNVGPIDGVMRRLLALIGEQPVG